MFSYLIRLAYIAVLIVAWIIIVNAFLILSTDSMEAKIRTNNFIGYIKRIMRLDKD